MEFRSCMTHWIRRCDSIYLSSKGSGEVARISATQTLNSMESFFFPNRGGFGSVFYFYLPSDHAAITCNLHIIRPGPVKMKISLRKLHDIDLDSFRTDILNSSLFFPRLLLSGLLMNLIMFLWISGTMMLHLLLVLQGVVQMHYGTLMNYVTWNENHKDLKDVGSLPNLRFTNNF